MKLLLTLKHMAFQQYRACLKRLSLPVDKYDLWRKTAVQLKLSAKAKLRLDWIVFYHTQANKNACLTCRHFGLKRAMWYYWFNRFEETNLTSLEDKSSAPLHTRQKEYTPRQYERTIALRRKYIRYGKVKLHRLYLKQYHDDPDFSKWKAQCIIEDSGLYYHPAINTRIQAKRQRAQKKKRITELKRKPFSGHLVCLDSIVKWFNGQKRYILTAIDKYGKIAYARMYANHSSLSAQDFLLRLNYLLDGEIENIQTDNGSEFAKNFNLACVQLGFDRYYSRVRTPTDNPDNERFNRTLKEEFIQLGNMTYDVNLFNRRLTEWLIEYNFNRPHQTLEYLTPIEFNQKYMKVSERWSSNTTICQTLFSMLYLP